MGNKKRIRIGSSDFKSMIETNSYYVDKSLFIEEVLETGNDVMLLPRPRRFGKTLNMSMLKEYFDIQHPDNYKLFENLKIWQCSEAIKSEQGKYPVIFLSLSSIEGRNWDECYKPITELIAGLFLEHNYLLDSEKLDEIEKKSYINILNKTADVSSYKGSLKFLSNLLHRYYDEKVVILMDEYDVPIQSSYGKYYDDSVNFMRSFMRGAFKDNSSLKKGVITGIMRVSRESIFSGLNNIGVFSILHDEFSDKFGFTSEEMSEMLDYYDIPTSERSKIRTWYDGYTFGETENIYNPWSVLVLLAGKKMRFLPHWANTSSNDLIKQEIKHKNNEEIRSDIMKLLNGQTIKKEIEENFVFPELESDKELVWTLFLFGGYITVADKISESTYLLRIPNYEVKNIFTKTIKNWFRLDVKLKRRQLEAMTDALLENDLVNFEKNFKNIISGVFSYHDTAENQEYVYHSYLLGLFAVMSDEYISKSNRESGEGRYDIMLIPREKDKNPKGFVFEIKRTDKQKINEKDTDFYDRINNLITKALDQINKNQYCTDLLDYGIAEENIIKIPIVFGGKIPYVNKIE